MLYRFVLDHGDFGMHNMTVALGKDSMPQITSVYDWEGGSVVPAILSEPKMVTTVDLVIDEDGDASISRWGDGDTPDKMSQYRTWTDEYYKVGEHESMAKCHQLTLRSVCFQRCQNISKSSRLVLMLDAFGSRCRS